MGLNFDGFPHFKDNVASRMSADDRERAAYWSDPARMKADPKQATTEIIRARMPGYFFDRAKSLLVSQPMKASDFDFDMGEWVFRDIEARSLDLAKMAPAFSGPVLVLHGRQDPTGESAPLALQRYYRNSRLVFVEQCGHYSWVEQPDKVLAEVSGFLSSK